MKPMLAVDAVLEKLRYPLVASPKLDGIRAIVVNGKLMSRSMKQIPNLFIFNTLSNSACEGLDGELIYGPPNAPDVCRVTTSAVMGHAGTPHITYHVFDCINKLDAEYRYRRAMAQGIVEAVSLTGVQVKMHEQREIHDEGQLLHYEDQCLEKGYEGLIVRNPNTLYKFGRSTVNEGFMLKIKRFSDDEAEIIGFEEEMHNTNEATKNELGRTKRSTAQAGLVGKGTLGAFIGRDIKSGAEFRCGTGFTAVERAAMWKNRDRLKGQLFKYKSFKIGVKDAPRHPVYISLRDKRDM